MSCVSLETCKTTLDVCLTSMWDEGKLVLDSGCKLGKCPYTRTDGKDTGHYLNMIGPSYTHVVCGFGFKENGGMLSTQNFGRERARTLARLPATTPAAPRHRRRRSAASAMACSTARQPRSAPTPRLASSPAARATKACVTTRPPRQRARLAHAVSSMSACSSVSTRTAGTARPRRWASAIRVRAGR